MDECERDKLKSSTSEPDTLDTFKYGRVNFGVEKTETGDSELSILSKAEDIHIDTDESKSVTIELNNDSSCALICQSADMGTTLPSTVMTCTVSDASFVNTNGTESGCHASFNSNYKFGLSRERCDSNMSAMNHNPSALNAQVNVQKTNHINHSSPLSVPGTSLLPTLYNDPSIPPDSSTQLMHAFMLGRLPTPTVTPFVANNMLRLVGSNVGLSSVAVMQQDVNQFMGGSAGHAGGSMDEEGRMAQEGVHEALSKEVFSSYRHREVIPGCLPHPGDIVEAASLSALDPPESSYPLTESLVGDIISTCKLSSLQLEGVMSACERHQLILADGKRAGFFVGDGAGVGKGRQIAAIIMDNFARGRTRHVWFSMSADLIVDARRDLTDLGCHIKVIEGCKQLDKETRIVGLPPDFQEGVVFSTYATLVSSIQRGNSANSKRQTRLQQLVSWCGGEKFEGCLIFDECHKAKHYSPGKEGASTKVATAVVAIQRILPTARVLYCSATGVADVKNMAFMERLGLWGEGAPFINFEAFLDCVQRKGLGVAEMLAMEMKMAGMYVSRGLSYKQAEFETVEANLTPDQIKNYNAAVQVWNELRRSLIHAMSRTNTNAPRLWSKYWGTHQRFFKQMCLAMKLPRLVDECKAALATGCCVVIGLQTTGEAGLDHELTRGHDTCQFMSLCGEMLRTFIETSFPTRIQGVYETDSRGMSTGQFITDEWSVQAKTILINFVNTITLPDSCLDEIIDKLGGPSKVSEMTGRRARIVRPAPTSKPRYEQRDSDTDHNHLLSVNAVERELFMKGKKLIAIISDAASTGISLHADLRCANQRRRVHLTFELPWSAEKAVQQLGRSHRSNQSSGPLFKLMTTDLGGERRFAASVAKRLQSLGALTKGDRRAATGSDLSQFNYDTVYGRAALRNMFTAICQKVLLPGITVEQVTKGRCDIGTFNDSMLNCVVEMGLVDDSALTIRVADKDATKVTHFLSRILGLSVHLQNTIFHYFTLSLNVTIETARREGRYNEGMLDITAPSVTLTCPPREVFKDDNKGNAVTKHITLNVDRGMALEYANQRLVENPGPDNGFYASRQKISGRRLYIIATRKENSKHLFQIARPNTGLSSFFEDEQELLQRYVSSSREDAEKGWQKQYDDTKERCMHGRGCRKGPLCTVGSRCYRVSLLCGSIVSLMSVLESVLSTHGNKYNIHKADMTLRVVQAKLDNGERVVGIRYPEPLIAEVEKILQERKNVYGLQKWQNYHLNTKGKAFLYAKDQTTASTQLGEKTELFDRNASASQMKARRQEPSAVIPRCLQKARTPPVTLHTFFRPKETKCTCDAMMGRSSLVTQLPGCQRCSTHTQCEYLSELCTIGSTDNERTDETVPDEKLEKKRVRNLESCDVKQSPRKKPKQATLFATFAKRENSYSKIATTVVTSSPLSQVSSVLVPSKCPICQADFKEGESNADINTHIDNCLIV